MRAAAGRALADVAFEYPERRDEVVAVLIKQLEDWAHQGPLLNALLVSYLAELQAVDAAPVIEAAFAAGAVDPTVNGDWEDVQIALALLDERVTPPTPWSPLRFEEEDEPVSGRVPLTGTQAGAKARNRRKTEKQARKRNRKK
ncbi:MAG TPA: hypothetical protein VFJ16_30945 [Longimicrobium sp.]|nr:hypothetical protein [Longimicrobium sp.]